MALDSQTVREIAHAVAATMIGISGYCLARCALAMQRIIRDAFEARGMLPPKRQNEGNPHGNPGSQVRPSGIPHDGKLRFLLDAFLRLLLIR